MKIVPRPLCAARRPERRLERRLEHWIVLGALAQGFEALWPRLVPILSLGAVFVAGAWLGLFDFLPEWLRLALAGAVVVVGIGLVVRLLRTRLPIRSEIIARLEADNRLDHQPLQTLVDRPADLGDVAGQALWQAHRQRAEAALDRLRPVWPRTGMPRRDPYALRFAALIVLAVALPAGLADPLRPLLDVFRLAPPPQGQPLRIDAWLTPPDYTGRAQQVLASGYPASAGKSIAVTVPEGTRLDVRLHGFEGAEAGFAPAGSVAAPLAGDAGSFVARLSQSGELTIAAAGRGLGDYAIAVTPNLPPTVRIVGLPAATAQGTLHLSFETGDQYGVVAGEARLTPLVKAGPVARPLYDLPTFPLLIAHRGPGTQKGETFRDLTAHPLAGTRVSLELTVRDAAGLSATSRAMAITLPAHRFRTPAARRVADARRTLAGDADRAGEVAIAVGALFGIGEIPPDNAAAVLMLKHVLFELRHAAGDDDLRAVVDGLWQAALALDGDGALATAAERLRQANEALRAALARAASADEVARRMAEVRAALDDYLRALEARRQSHPDDRAGGASRIMTPGELAAMLDRIEDLNRIGDHADAERLMADLQRMLENLGNAGGGTDKGAGGTAKSLDALTGIIGRQEEIQRKTWRLAPKTEEGADDAVPPGDVAPPDAAALRALGGEEQALRADLGRILESLGPSADRSGAKPPAALGQALRSMGDAVESLADGRPGDAVGDEGRVLAALRRGANALAAGQGAGQGASSGDGGESDGRDPLGRPGGGTKLPAATEVERSRRILDEIRRRAVETDRPAGELDYLDRLLRTY